MIENLVKQYIKKESYVMGGMPLSKAHEIYKLGEIEKLSANENQFGVSPKAVCAGVAILPEANFYPDVEGYRITDKLCEQLGVEKNQILLTHGGTAALTMIGDVFLDKDDEVIMPVPTYQAYQNMIDKNGAVKKEVRTNDRYEVDLEAMLEAITPKTKMIILCNPNNPTGVYCSKEKVKEFLDRIPQNIILLVDEAYIQFVESPNASMVDCISSDKNLIIVQTFSKVYGMAGFRLGYVLSNSEIIRALKVIWDPFSPNAIALAAGAAALEDYDFVNRTISEMIEGRRYLTEELEAMGVKVYASQTNFVSFDCGMKSDVLMREILENSGVLIRGTFEKPRVTIGTMEQNRKFIEAMHRVMNQQKER